MLRGTRAKRVKGMEPFRSTHAKKRRHLPRSLQSHSRNRFPQSGVFFNDGSRPTLFPQISVPVRTDGTAVCWAPDPCSDRESGAANCRFVVMAGANGSCGTCR